jgi:hypothetical protein
LSFAMESFVPVRDLSAVMTHEGRERLQPTDP